jgi:hypothetical protein
MCSAIDNLAICKIRAVIRFLHAKNMSAVKIRPELCAIYGQNAMSEGTVRQWCRMLKDGRTNVHGEERSDGPVVVSDDDVQIVDQKFEKDSASQFQNFHVNFHNFHALFSTRFSQLGQATTSFAQEGFRKCSKRRERLRL